MDRGRSLWDGSGAAEQGSSASTDVPTPFIYHLQNSEHLDPFRSSPMFGELGLITSLKDSI